MKVFLFSTTLRWLNFFWKSITEVARPIKRGNGYWSDKTPSKKKFSRHYNRASVSWKFGELLCEYKQSFSKPLGFMIQMGKGTIFTDHLMTVTRLPGEVLRRTQANWSIEKLALKANDSFIFLLIPQERSNSDAQVRVIQLKYIYIIFIIINFVSFFNKNLCSIPKSSNFDQAGSKLFRESRSVELLTLKGQK